MRRRLSNVAEEDHYLAADERCDACAAALKPLIRARLASQAAALNRPALAMALAYAAPSGLRMAMDSRVTANAWTEAQFAEPTVTQKAKRGAGTTEAEILRAAVDAGLELGLKTLPANVAREVDVDAARKIALRKLKAGAFRRNLADLEESQIALGRLVAQSRDPALATLTDAETLASMFGLTARQAESLAKETRFLADAGKKADPIRRAMRKRVQQALEARAELLSQQLGNEAINTAQAALYEQARIQGLLDEAKQVQEWVTRRDERVCPRCDAFDGERAPVGDLFESDEGEESYGPQLHPLCRCRLRIVTLRQPKRGKRAA